MEQREPPVMFGNMSQTRCWAWASTTRPRLPRSSGRAVASQNSTTRAGGCRVVLQRRTQQPTRRAQSANQVRALMGAQLSWCPGRQADSVGSDGGQRAKVRPSAHSAQTPPTTEFLDTKQQKTTFYQ